MSTLTQDILKTLLHYEPKTGVFTWLARTSNRVKVGDVAGRMIDSRGFQRVTVLGQKNYVSRLAWLYMTGAWPKGEIDHINGNRRDNRWENLRDVDRLLNRQNQRKAYSNSRTGLQGASPARRGKFAAHITVRGETKYLGTFNAAEDAHEAFLKAKRAMHEGCTI